jgi:hypothetical protein
LKGRKVATVAEVMHIKERNSRGRWHTLKNGARPGLDVSPAFGTRCSRAVYGRNGGYSTRLHAYNRGLPFDILDWHVAAIDEPPFEVARLDSENPRQP